MEETKYLDRIVTDPKILVGGPAKMKMPSEQSSAGPKLKVKQALFALSGNRCAFPECDAAMFRDDTIVGDICHIQAQSPGGPRYVDGLSREELHGMKNLMLLCKLHHKIVDEHPDQYTSEQLRELKYKHESRDLNVSNELLHRLLEALAPSVPDNWWERPSAPVFRLQPSSNRPPTGQWTFTLELEQVDGGDVGRLQARLAHGSDAPKLQPPDLMRARKWRLGSISFTPQDEPFEVQLVFWWDGAERCVTHHWGEESDFQTAQTTVSYA
jgi:hypothetical protein